MNADLTEREKNILNLLAEQGSVSVSALSQQLCVSEVTIRSDLKNLEECGYLNRSHGGATPTIHPGIFARQNACIEEKSRIVKMAATLVHSGDTIMIEAGSTTGLLPRFLIGKRDIHVITNSVSAFNAARANPSLKVTISGGEYRNITDSFVGSLTQETISRFNVKYAFVGTDGFSIKAGITTHLMEGGDIIRVMREKAEKLIVLADSSKYNRLGVVSILPLKSVDMIITDSKISEKAITDMREENIPIIVV